MNSIASIVLTFGLLVSMIGPGDDAATSPPDGLRLLRDQLELSLMSEALDVLLIDRRADVSNAERKFLYPLDKLQEKGASWLPTLMPAYALYVVVRQELQPTPDYEERLRAVRVPDPPEGGIRMRAHEVNPVIDALLARQITNEQAAVLLLRMFQDVVLE